MQLPCHPQSAIIDLEGDIGAIETTLTTLQQHCVEITEE